MYKKCQRQLNQSFIHIENAFINWILFWICCYSFYKFVNSLKTKFQCFTHHRYTKDSNCFHPSCKNNLNFYIPYHFYVHISFISKQMCIINWRMYANFVYWKFWCKLFQFTKKCIFMHIFPYWLNTITKKNWNTHVIFTFMCYTNRHLHIFILIFHIDVLWYVVFNRFVSRQILFIQNRFFSEMSYIWWWWRNIESFSKIQLTIDSCI